MSTINIRDNALCIKLTLDVSVMHTIQIENTSEERVNDHRIRMTEILPLRTAHNILVRENNRQTVDII